MGAYCTQVLKTAYEITAAKHSHRKVRCKIVYITILPGYCSTVHGSSATTNHLHIRAIHCMELPNYSVLKSYHKQGINLQYPKVTAAAMLRKLISQLDFAESNRLIPSMVI